MIRAEPHIAVMSPYAVARFDRPEGKPLLSLSQNESLRPPSPRALDAAAAVLASGALYPDPDWCALRAALAEHHRLEAGQILCGNGSLELIGVLARVFSGPGRAVLAPRHAYPFFRTAAGLAGARFDTAEERDATVCVDCLLEAVRAETALVFVANPGNPTGTRIPLAEIRRLRAGLRPDILLVVDEAYGEFTEEAGARAFDMVAAGDTVVLRTFSKAYGMAGFRVGWGLFPLALAAEMRKAMNPNNVAAASQAAAVAALADEAYMRETCARTADLRERGAAALREAGFSVAPSHTNFLLIDMESPEAAQAADAALRAEGVFLRMQAGASLPGCLRMTIAPWEAIAQAIALLETWKRNRGR
ncbi:MAG: histidinol-phosphate transaminase [Roseovarius sp.]